MQAELVRNEMRSLGFHPDTIALSEQFISHFCALAPRAEKHQATTVYLRQNREANFFENGANGDVYINIGGFSDFDENSHIFVQFTLETLSKKRGAKLFTIDWDSIEAALDQTFSFNTATQLHKYLSLFDYFHRKQFGKGIGFFSKRPIIDLNKPPNLYIRPGNVELRAARTILRHPENLEQIAIDIYKNWDSPEFFYEPDTSDDVQVSDLSFSIRQLLTNAGMYAIDPPSLVASLHGWANRYISACFTGSEILLNWSYGMHTHAVRTAAAENGLRFGPNRRVQIGPVLSLYEQLAEKTILLISPFATTCVKTVESGNVKRLWKNHRVPDFKLIGLDAYITTYPNRPHRSWLETFYVLCSRIDGILAQTEIDLVMGSCGCYGLPLMDYCYKRHGISSFYFGNLTHLFFGIRQNDFAQYMSDANAEFWANPFHEISHKPKNFNLIDNGRYIVGE